VFAGQSEDVHLLVVAEPGTTAIGTAVSSFQAERLWCHLLISNIPDAGVAEALDTLTDVFEFYEPGVSIEEGAQKTALAAGHVTRELEAGPVVIEA
jgi:hypothetical protein